MDALTSIDTESRTCTLQAGMRSTRAEQLLGEHGFTLGHFPQSYEGASIGGYAATRAAGQASAGYGRFDEMVIGLVLATPGGTITLGAAQKSAAGPDLRELVMGSEGTLGVITEVTVRVHPAPEERTYDGWRFDSFEQGAAALRTLVQDGPVPTVLRLSDEAETAVNLADPSGNSGSGPGGCLSIAGYEGARDEVSSRRAAASAVLTAAGGEALGTAPGEAWRAGRYLAPYLRDSLLDKGASSKRSRQRPSGRTLRTCAQRSRPRSPPSSPNWARRRSCSATSRTSTKQARLSTSPSSARQGSGHGARQAGSLDRLTWLFVAMGRLLLALGAPKLM
jgi:alkyldihydroxyacetonephosphate synthase